MISFATRATWGFSNPNDAAAFWLLAGIVLLALVQRAALGRVRIVLSVAVTIGILFLVLATESRGAVLAAIVAATFLLLSRRRLLVLRSRILSGFISSPRVILLPAFFFLLVTTLIILFPVGERIRSAFTGTDRSITGRIPLYTSVPAMIAAAPAGWGSGNAAHAWHHWFEPIGGTENYRHLLSSHATWLVELPVIGRVLYLSGWIALLLAGVTIPFGGSFISAAGMLAACNHVLAHPAVLSIFLLGAAVIVIRYGLRVGFGKRFARDGGLAFAAGAILCLGLTATGHAIADEPTVSCNDDWIAVGDPDDASVVVALPDETIVGNKFGHAVRRSAAQGRFVQVSRNEAGSLPDGTDSKTRILLLGDSPVPDLEEETGPITWINPPALPSAQALARLEALRAQAPTQPITILWGEWRRDAPARPWRDAAVHISPQADFRMLDATGRFVADPFSHLESPTE